MKHKFIFLLTIFIILQCGFSVFANEDLKGQNLIDKAIAVINESLNTAEQSVFLETHEGQDLKELYDHPELRLYKSSYKTINTALDKMEIELKKGNCKLHGKNPILETKRKFETALKYERDHWKALCDTEKTLIDNRKKAGVKAVYNIGGMMLNNLMIGYKPSVLFCFKGKSLRNDSEKIKKDMMRVKRIDEAFKIINDEKKYTLLFVRAYRDRLEEIKPLVERYNNLLALSDSGKKDAKLKPESAAGSCSGNIVYCDNSDISKGKRRIVGSISFSRNGDQGSGSFNFQFTDGVGYYSNSSGSANFNIKRTSDIAWVGQFTIDNLMLNNSKEPLKAKGEVNVIVRNGKIDGMLFIHGCGPNLLIRGSGTNDPSR
jgi:hypothetical protein